MVQRGKLAAWIQVPQDSIDSVIELIKSEGLQCSVEESNDWYNVWMWCEPLAAELIRALPTVREQLPAAARIWYEGTLFGYSVESIRTYLREFSDKSPNDTGLLAHATRG
jgi:hypothetical protein